MKLIPIMMTSIFYFLMMKILISCCLLVCLIWLTNSASLSYQSGNIELVLEGFKETSTTSTLGFMADIRPFRMAFRSEFKTVPQVILSVTGFEGDLSSQVKSGVLIQQISTNQMSLTVIIETGWLNMIQVNYLVFDQRQAILDGLLVWQRPAQNFEQNTKLTKSLTTTIPILQKHQNILKRFQTDHLQYLFDLETNEATSDLVQIIPFISGLWFYANKPMLYINATITYPDEQTHINVQIIYQHHIKAKKGLPYFLVIQNKLNERSRFQLQLQMVEMKNNENSVTMMNDNKLWLIGLNKLEHNCSCLSQLTLHSDNDIPRANLYPCQSQYETYMNCVGQVFTVQLWQNNYNSSAVPTTRLLSSCPVGQVFSDWNWTKILVYPDKDLIGKTDSSRSCQKCPIGCLSCHYIEGLKSHCWNGYCDSCNSQYNIAIRSNSCTSRQYCRCKTSNYWPQSSTGDCVPCNVAIPGCNSCNMHEWGGTYCTSCAMGTYGYQGDMPRICASCPTGCNNCNGGTSCNTCANNLVKISGVCRCNTSQNIYYNPVNNNCGACSSVISNCNSCSSPDGLTTTCNSCATGTFYNSSSNICQFCTTNCASCTATSCSLCVSASFSKTGDTCYCDSSEQLFIDSTVSPAQCTPCNTHIVNCISCSGAPPTLICDTCQIGYYYDGSDCVPCLTHCGVCNSTSECDNCLPTFIITNNDTTCQCDTINNVVLNLAGTACVNCNFIIPNCLVCVTSPTLYCNQCNDPFFSASVNDTLCSVCSLQCSSCTDALTCTACEPGYTLSAPSCIPNNPGCQGVTDCVDCNATDCTTCAPGTWLDPPVCRPCPIRCLKCDNNVNCTVCDSPFVLFGTSCQCNTYNQQYYDPIGLTCGPCSSAILNCTSCIGIGLSTQCSQCQPGTYLFNNTYCDPCPLYSTTCLWSNISTSCLPTFTLIEDSCQCDAAYEMYLDSVSSSCIVCSTLILNCLGCNDTGAAIQCLSCGSGYYVDINLECTSCPITCVTCADNQTCNDCADTYTLINGTCQCDNDMQMFEDCGSCAPCYHFINLCLQCSSATTCNTCPTATYLDALNASCIKCPINCISCDASGCLNCTLGFVQNAGTCQYLDTCGSYLGMDSNCVDCSNSTTVDNVTGTVTVTEYCNACQEGFYLFVRTNCIACPASCLTCGDAYTCYTCKDTYTLQSGSCLCNTYNGEVEDSGICVVCSAFIEGCATCNATNLPPTCLVCGPGYTLTAGACSACPMGCLTCSNSTSCTSCADGYLLDTVAQTCTDDAGCSSSQYFDGNVCLNCPSNCASCLDSSSCISCDATFSLIDGVCTCDSNKGLFGSVENSICNLCGQFNSSTYGVYTQNCQVCQMNPSNLTASFECKVCLQGFYLVSGRCQACQQGCSQCLSNISCFQCQQPAYKYSSGICICNNQQNYFINGSVCDLCVLPNCIICSALTTCSICQTGYFLNPAVTCQPQICSDGFTHGSQGCDDGNLINGDGCSSICQIQLFYLCINSVTGMNSTCFLDTARFSLTLEYVEYQCNMIDFGFKFGGTQATQISQCTFNSLLSSHTVKAALQSYSFKNNIITYHFLMNQTIQNDQVQFIFNPNTLCIPNAYNLMQVTVNTLVDPTNNYPAIYYPEDQCQGQQEVQALVDAIQYTSYSLLILSALPAKIVGLELFGVLQVAFISLGSIDNVNLMLSPLKKMKGVHGLNLDLGQDKTNRLLQDNSSRLLQVYTPQRIDSIDYHANFLRNVNLMLIIVIVILLIGFIFYLLTYCFKGCAPTLHRIGQRIVKQILLTLILFNMLNFAYSAGIHFKYAPSNDQLYLFGTLAAVGVIVIPIAMACALQCTSEEGFGEFKDKLKPGKLEKAYFVITILYRMGLGLYLSTNNEDDLSTLIVLAITIMFLLYNLVNLPFAKAYHNYRANICHFTQFITLFVAMYYRSMRSSQSIQNTADIYGPAYFQYACIFISLVVSMVVLSYQIYIFIKGCCCGEKEEEWSNGSQQDSRADLKDQAHITIQPLEGGNQEAKEGPLVFEHQYREQLPVEEYQE